MCVCVRACMRVRACVRVCVCAWGGGERERERQTDRQTDRQTETERQSERERDRWATVDAVAAVQWGNPTPLYAGRQ